MIIIALHSAPNISETVRDRGLVPKEMAYGVLNGHMTDDVTHVTSKGAVRQYSRLS